MRTDEISNQAQVLVGFHAQGLVDFQAQGLVGFSRFSKWEVGLDILCYR